MKRILSVLLLVAFFAAAGSAPAGAQGGGYGYISHDGVFVVEPQFDYAYAFKEGRARVFRGTLNDWGTPKDGQYAFIDSAGDTVIPFIYEKAEDFKNGLAVVKMNGKYGVIDTDGRTVIDFRYDGISISRDRVLAFTGSAKEGRSFDVFSAEGKTLFSLSCKSLSYYDGCYGAYNEGKCALAAETGSLITDYVWDGIVAVGEEGILGFKSGEKYGYIDRNGQVLIPAQYDEVGLFADGKALVKKDGRYSLIDEAGNTLAEYRAVYANMNIVNGVFYAFDGTLTESGFPDSGGYYLMSTEGEQLTPGYENCYAVDASSSTWRVQDGKKWGVIDFRGNIVFPFTECDHLFYCGDDYILEKNDLYAVSDAEGNLKTDFVFSDMSIPNKEADLIAARYLKTEPDFRQTRWGMSMDEVKASEGSSPDYKGTVTGTGAEYIGYDTQLMGNDAIVVFYFGKDGLYQARYIWTEKHSNDSFYINDYNDVKKQLTKKYGNPLFDNESWDTSAHESYYKDRKGDALSYGYLSYLTYYVTDRTAIMMSMDADNYKVSFIIDYAGKTVSAPEEDYSDVF